MVLSDILSQYITDLLYLQRFIHQTVLAVLQWITTKMSAYDCWQTSFAKIILVIMEHEVDLVYCMWTFNV